MNICYLCGEEMIDSSQYEANKQNYTEVPKINHAEHIIQNALFGKLKPTNILCKTCGNDFSQDIDKGFVSLFFPITERIKQIAITKDHGKDSSNPLKGVLYTDPELKSTTDIIWKERKISPKEPFYDYQPDSKKVIIYANKSRAKNYKNLVIKELIAKGIDVTELEFDLQDDISGHGILGVYFTQGIADFNERFKPGFAKIAIGFATYCGISREQLPKALKINSEGKGEILSEGNLLPFFPLGATDYMYELNRPDIEECYPSHTLILFSQKVGERNFLFCYIDLFSTFQYYVLLNDEYEGKEIYEHYYQTTLKQEKTDIDIRSIRLKHLNIVIDEFGIDRTKYSGNSMEDFYEFLEKEIKNLKYSSVQNFEDKLASSFARLNREFLLSKIPNFPQRNSITDSFRNLHERQEPGFIAEMLNYFNEDEKFMLTPFRRIFLEHDEGEINAQSTPWESNGSSISPELRKHYGHLKFNQISKFIDEIEDEDKGTDSTI